VTAGAGWAAGLVAAAVVSVPPGGGFGAGCPALEPDAAGGFDDDILIGGVGLAVGLVVGLAVEGGGSAGGLAVREFGLAVGGGGLASGWAVGKCSVDGRSGDVGVKSGDVGVKRRSGDGVGLLMG
jgi:hypothetical protein